jgi:hypothetical protein
MYPSFLVLSHSNKNKHGENAGKLKMWLVLTTKVLYLLVGYSIGLDLQYRKYLPFSSARADELITLPGCCCSHSTRSTIGAVIPFPVNDFHVCSDNTVNMDMDMVVLSLRRCCRKCKSWMFPILKPLRLPTAHLVLPVKHFSAFFFARNVCYLFRTV